MRHSGVFDPFVRGIDCVGGVREQRSVSVVELKRLKVDCALGPAGNEIMGHEFHYARTLSIGDEPLVDCRDVSGAPVPEAGGRRGSVSGTFFHAISTRPA